MKNGIKVLSLLMMIYLSSGLSLANGQTQDVDELASLTIELLPEFDKAGVLVIYEGKLNPSASLPAKVSFLLDSNIYLNAVAFRDPTNDKLIMGKYETANENGKTKLTAITLQHNFWIEFYTSENSIELNGEERKFEYTWNGDIAIKELNWKIQQPANGLNLIVEPSGGHIIRDDYGLSAYLYTIPNSPKEKKLTVKVKYNKPDNRFTSAVIGGGKEQEPPTGFPDLGQGSGQSLNDGEFESSEKNNKNYIILIIVAIGLLAIGYIFLGKKRK